MMKNNLKNKKIYIAMITIAIASFMLNGCSNTPEENFLQAKKVLIKIEAGNTCIKNTAASYVRHFGVPVGERGFTQIKRICKKSNDFDGIHGSHHEVMTGSNKITQEKVNACYTKYGHYIFHDYSLMAESAHKSRLIHGIQSLTCNKKCENLRVSVVFSNDSIKRYCQRKIRREIERAIIKKENNNTTLKVSKPSGITKKIK
jgi:hypothetical protein